MRNGQNIKRARRLRRDASGPERRAWTVLRRFRGLGVPIRRQHPIAGLTVDFAAADRRLVIEIDGPVHDTPEQRRRDIARDRTLKAAGWRVLRIPAETASDPDTLFRIVAETLGLDR